MGERVKGHLFIIGGAEDKTGRMEILGEIVRLTDGGRVVVMTTATEHPEEAGRDYERLFSDLGAREVESVRIDTRREAEGQEAARALRRADAVFLPEAISCALPASWEGRGCTRRCLTPTGAAR